MSGKFIVIEGLDATGKSTLVSKLVDQLNAVSLKCPPRLDAPELSVRDLRSYFDDRPHAQRRAYYRAANLIASEQAVRALEDSHVVMDRYWTSTVAYIALDEGFDVGEQFEASYPPELREPDAVILLTVNEEKRVERIRERNRSVEREEQKLEFDAVRRENVLRRYRGFSPIEIDTSHRDPEAVLQATLDILHNSGIILNEQLA
ncbi:MAG: AAA family ATPase [Albidovulum sp.]|nr:AAA family ATPase [Albidovulum sp.]